jgi:hypothetical protein
MSGNRTAKARCQAGIALTVPSRGLISPRMTPLPTMIAERRRRISAARMRVRA